MPVAPAAAAIRSAISAMFAYGRAVAVVMQVMELADAGEAGLQHLDIELRGDRLDLVGRHRQREAVHHLAPAPETVGRRPARLGQPGHAALEGVAVQVGHRRNDDRVALVAWLQRQRRRSRHAVDLAAFDANADIARPAVGRGAPGRAKGSGGVVMPIRPRRGLKPLATLQLDMYIHIRIPFETEKIMAAEGGTQSRARVWRNARLATLVAGPPGLGHRRAAARSPRTTARSSIAGPEVAASGCRGRRCRDHRLRRPLDHARPDRLPHPSGPCRQPRQRVRDAACRRDLRGGGAGRRRHRLVGQGAACGERRRAGRRRRCRASTR